MGHTAGGESQFQEISLLSGLIWTENPGGEIFPARKKQEESLTGTSGKKGELPAFKTSVPPWSRKVRSGHMPRNVRDSKQETDIILHQSFLNDNGSFPEYSFIRGVFFDELCEHEIRTA
ncbi:MAG: hypothetical protein M8353_00145 [ANME-2 cluster archaeon]|nr:hypothetical protein [ANME-2 cluster archaeon]